MFCCTQSGGGHSFPEPEQKVVVSLENEFQTIHSFGASGCWSAKFIGKWADESKRNHIADLLFSQDTLADGQPKGIGLSLWRMNIGAGSYEQGEGSDIKDPWRREECFQNAQGQYDWSKQAGSQWFLRAARQRGVKYTLGFSISPPVYMTLNGKAFSPGGGSLNLKPGLMPAFADFLTEVSNHFGFDYLSPLNEPQWDWKAGNDGKASQEGTPAQNKDILDVTQALSQTLFAKNSKTTVVNGETAQLNFLYERAESGRGDQMKQLFSGSPSLRNLPKVENILAYHSYFTTCDDANWSIRGVRRCRRRVPSEILTCGKVSLVFWATFATNTAATRATPASITACTSPKSSTMTYTTSREKNLVKSTAPSDKMQMEPKSVTTFVGYY